jgi:hypothetical protein
MALVVVMPPNLGRDPFVALEPQLSKAVLSREVYLIASIHALSSPADSG